MYYEVISNQKWGAKENYDLCINCEIGNDKVVNVICKYIENKKNNNKKDNLASGVKIWTFFIIN